MGELLRASRPSGLTLRVGPVGVRPLRVAEGPCPRVVSAAAALREGTLRIAELRPPTMSTVLADNLCDQPVLVPAGAVLRGGAQTRIVAVSVVVPGLQRELVAVRCVEIGRWTDHRDPVFRGVDAAPLGIQISRTRREASARLSGRHRAEDQGETWHDVAGCLHAHQVVSSTHCLQEASDLAEADVRRDRAHLVQDQQAGAEESLVGAAGLVVSSAEPAWAYLELTGARSLRRGCSSSLLRAVELETRRAAVPGDRGRQWTDSWLDDLSDGLDSACWTQRRSGAAELLDFAVGSGAVGTALVSEDCVLSVTVSWIG